MNISGSVTAIPKDANTSDHPTPGLTFFPASGQWGLVERGVAALTLVALGMRQFVGGQGLTIGYAIALVLLPIWLRAPARFHGGRALLVMSALTAISGVIVSRFSAATHVVIQGNFVGGTVLIVGSACAIGVILWARSILTIRAVGFFYGTGLLVGALLLTPHGTANDWKFVWAVPLAVTVLSAVERPQRRLMGLVALLIFAGLSALLDSRSYFATFLLAAALSAWQMRPYGLSRRVRWVWTACLMGLLSLGTYFLGTTLLVGGFLGQAAQARSVQQIREAGSLILGGRPELAATVALMKEYPWAFGVGVVPTPTEVLTAKAGMARINYDPNNGYVERYMFGDRFELHSVFGDLWANYSVTGLILCLLILLLVVRSLAWSVAARQGGAAMLFLGCWTLWNLAFSPLYSAVPTLVIALGLCLLPVRPSPRSLPHVNDEAIDPEERRWQHEH